MADVHLAICCIQVCWDSVIPSRSTSTELNERLPFCVFLPFKPLTAQRMISAQLCCLPAPLPSYNISTTTVESTLITF